VGREDPRYRNIHMSRVPTSFIDIDFETRSELNITVVGARKYAGHYSTQILMISFSSDQKKVYNWNPYFSTGENLTLLNKAIKKVKRGKAVFRAHNSEFEYWIWNLVGTRQFNWPELEVESFYDTMVLACIAGFPASLENAGDTLGLIDKKDKKGKGLINFFCNPSRKKDADMFNHPHEHKAKFEDFIDYCNSDVKAQMGIVRACPPMTQRQWEVFTLTEKMNVRGIPIDLPMVHGALDLVDKYKTQADKRIQKITNGEIESATQNVKLKEWLNAKDCDIPNMQAATIEKYLNHPKTTPFIKNILQIRSDVSKSSTAKYKAALTYITPEGLVHGFLKAFIAKTGRWGGRGLQIQNFSKPEKDFPYWCDFDVLAEAIKNSDTRLIDILYGGIMDSLKAATRSMINAFEGYTFICADYAQIEARIVMWLAGDKTGMADFAGEGKIYESMAGDIFNVAMSSIKKPSFERDIGKETVLGCGFGMGWKKFLSRCVEQRGLDIIADIAQKAVKGYRTKYERVPKAWKECEAAAIKAIQNPGVAYSACQGKLSYRLDRHFLTVRLPSGRKLYYPQAKTIEGINDWGQEQTVIYYKTWNQNAPAGRKWEYEKIWGGTLFQHCVQAIAMDIMSDGMLNAEKEGYHALFTVHDESLSMVKKDFGSVKEYENLLCQLKPWAKGLLIVAEGWEGSRYRK